MKLIEGIKSSLARTWAIILTVILIVISGLPLAAQEPPPTFSKDFSPNPIGAGGTTTLTFTINNSASSLDADNLAFTDNLPAGVVVAAVPNASTTCTGGTIAATSASGVISYSGGTVAAGASCTIKVDVTIADVPGEYVNTTGNLTSSSGNSGNATATLQIEPPPTFSKNFSPNPITVGGTTTLTFTIDNSASTLAATGLDFTDNLPAGVVVAAAPNASSTCTGGAITADAGTGVIAYSGGTVAAFASCTIQVDVTSSTADAYSNTTGDLTSSSGSSGTAQATLTVNAPPQVAVTKTDALTTDDNNNGLVDVGDVLTYTVVITNIGSGPASDVVFSDLAGDHPDATLVDGSVTASPGTVTSGNGGGPDTDVTVDVGTMAPAESATITFQVTVGDPSPDSEVCNQGTVSGSNFADVLTDDPETPTADDPTCTQVMVNAAPLLPHDFLFLADEFVETKQHKLIEGNIHSNNDIEIKKGKKSEIIGDLVAVDDVEIAKKNNVDGNVISGDDVDNDGDVSGTISEDANVSEIPIPPGAPFAFGDGDFEVDKKESGELDPGAYKEVEVKKRGTLLLKHDGASGEYFLKTLELDKKATLCIDVSNGPVVINVARELVFGKESEVIIKPNGQGDTELVTFNFSDDDDKKEALEIGKKAIVLGSIIAPDAWVVLNDKARFKGTICAENIVVKKGVVAYHHSVSGSLPKIVPDEYDDEEELLIAAAIPTEFELTQNYPNPFNPSTTISFALPKAGDVSLKIYNLRGQLVTTLHDGALTSGRHQMVWDGRDRRGLQVASGIYVYRLEADGFVTTKKLTLMK